MISLRQLSACALLIALVAAATIASRPARGAGGARTKGAAAAAADDDDDEGGRDMVILPRKAGPRLPLPGGKARARFRWQRRRRPPDRRSGARAR